MFEAAGHSPRPHTGSTIDVVRSFAAVVPVVGDRSVKKLRLVAYSGIQVFVGDQSDWAVVDPLVIEWLAEYLGQITVSNE